MHYRRTYLLSWWHHEWKKIVNKKGWTIVITSHVSSHKVFCPDDIIWKGKEIKKERRIRSCLHVLSPCLQVFQIQRMISLGNRAWRVRHQLLLWKSCQRDSTFETVLDALGRLGYRKSDYFVTLPFNWRQLSSKAWIKVDIYCISLLILRYYSFIPIPKPEDMLKDYFLI